MLVKQQHQQPVVNLNITNTCCAYDVHSAHTWTCVNRLAALTSTVRWSRRGVWGRGESDKDAWRARETRKSLIVQATCEKGLRLFSPPTRWALSATIYGRSWLDGRLIAIILAMGERCLVRVTQCTKLLSIRYAGCVHHGLQIVFYNFI